MKILITGAAGGLGRATCSACIANGHTVFGCDLIEDEQYYASDTIIIPADITQEQDVKTLSHMLGTHGGIEAIVHMAGMFKAGPLLEVSPDMLSEILATNLIGVARINAACAEQLAHHKGKIIIVSSELGVLSPAPFTGQYAISKHALEAYATSLRREAKSLGISVTTVRPGSFMTSMHTQAMSCYKEIEVSSQKYGPIITKAMPFIRSEMQRAHNPEIVASHIIKALHAKNPRESISIRQSIPLKFLNLLPTRLQDYVYARVFTGDYTQT